MSFIGGKIVGRDAEARVYQAAHFGWFYIFDGLTSDFVWFRGWPVAQWLCRFWCLSPWLASCQP